jgi:drug/metabolite transporter (DMT)-like permease
VPLSSSLSSGIILGGAAALGAAFLWAIATMIFKKLGEDIPPAELNLVKCSFALVLMVITSLLLSETLPRAGLLPYFLLACSGIIGIGLGDTAFFFCLNHLGSKLAILLGILAPPMAGIISWMFLGENLKLISWLGIFVTLAGVAWVIWQEQQDNQFARKHLWKGIGFGLIACLAQSVGAVFSRYALTETTISALQTAIIRILAGIFSLAVLILLSRKPAFAWLHRPADAQPPLKHLLGMIALVGTMGTYVAIWLQQISLQYAPVGIAQTCLSTSPIFILPISAIRGEKVTWKSVIGVVIALTGVVMLFTLG